MRHNHIDQVWTGYQKLVVEIEFQNISRNFQPRFSTVHPAKQKQKTVSFCESGGYSGRTDASGNSRITAHIWTSELHSFDTSCSVSISFRVATCDPIPIKIEIILAAMENLT
eukprot:c15355_g1_i1.p1 GENE.c15355_g1_i1~~c15355_g1_i1.p1  ORF type:complete len:112 (-),score=30.76 c15355_g1_i1:102-437(-)